MPRFTNLVPIKKHVSRGLKSALTDIPQIAAGSFANLPRFRVLGNPAPVARAVDGDGTSRRHAERLKLPNFPSLRRTSPVSLARTRNERTLYALDVTGGDRGSAIIRGMSANRFRGMATSAIWNAT